MKVQINYCIYLWVNLGKNYILKEVKLKSFEFKVMKLFVGISIDLRMVKSLFDQQ